MRRNLLGCFALFMILLLSIGCGSREVVKHNYVYKGETPNWTAEYHVSGQGVFTKKTGRPMDYESRPQYEFVVTYKGDAADLAAIDGMGYGFESSAGSRKRTFTGPPSPGQKQFTIEQRFQLGGAIERRDETITAEVTWNGRTETTQLQPVP